MSDGERAWKGLERPVHQKITARTVQKVTGAKHAKHVAQLVLGSCCSWPPSKGTTQKGLARMIEADDRRSSHRKGRGRRLPCDKITLVPGQR